MAGAGICAVCLGGGFAIHPCLARDPTRHPGWVRWLRLAGWGCCGQRRVNGNVGQRVAGAAVEAPPAGHQLRCAVAKRGVHLLGRELRLQVARHRCDLEMGHGTVDQAHVDLVTGLQRPQPVKAAGPGGRLLAKVTAEPILARRRTQPEPAGPGILDGHLDGPIGVEPEGGRHQRDTYGRDPQHDRYRTCHYPGRLTDPGADGVRAIWLMACPTAWLTVSLMARRPDILLLDEPTVGLDPLMEAEFQSLTREAAARGQTVFLSSHLLDEVEDLCHRVAILRSGVLVEVAALEDLRRLTTTIFEASLSGPVPVFTDLPEVIGVEPMDGGVRVTVSGAPGEVLTRLNAAGITRLHSQAPTLEQIFLTYYETSSSQREAVAAAHGQWGVAGRGGGGS